MLPEVIVGAIEHRSAQGQDGVQPLGSRAHARSPETRGHHSFTKSLDAHTPDLLDSSVPLDPLDSSDSLDSPKTVFLTKTLHCIGLLCPIGLIRPIGLVRLIGLIRLIGPIGLIGLIGPN